MLFVFLKRKSSILFAILLLDAIEIIAVEGFSYATVFFFFVLFLSLILYTCCSQLFATTVTATALTARKKKQKKNKIEKFEKINITRVCRAIVDLFFFSSSFSSCFPSSYIPFVFSKLLLPFMFIPSVKCILCYNMCVCTKDT